MLHEEVKVANSLEEAVTIHDFPSSLEARVNELKDALKILEERYNFDSDYVEENALSRSKNYF